MSAALPNTVLVLRFSAVGDIVLTTGALQALAEAWPDTRILFVTKARFVGLIRHNPHVDEVVGLEDGEGLSSFRARLAAFAPEAILDLHGKLRSRLLASLVPRRRRVRWRKRSLWQSLAVRSRLARYRAEMPIATRYHRAVEALVQIELPAGEMRYDVGDAERQTAGDKLRAAGVDLDRPLVSISPGAVWETKCWPADRFGALSARILKSGVQVVLNGSPAERTITAEVAECAPGTVDLAGELSLTELGALVDLSTAFVANDSGPMHIARALGVPTLAIFGSTDPSQFDFTGHALMFAGTECSPCSLYGLSRCPKRHFRCMLDLDVDQAWAALEPLLSKGRVPLVPG